MNMKRATAVILGALLLPGVAMAQVDTRATFSVTKDFADGNNVAEVVVSIDCNTGQILDQDKTLGDGDTVEFVVTAFTSGSLNCSIVEGDTTNGYSATYVGDGDADDCTWTAVDDTDANNCTITNTPDPVEIKVTKNWVIEGDNNDVNLGYSVKAYCYNVVDTVESPASHTLIGSGSGTGPGSKTFTFTVVPNFPSSSCYADENGIDSAVESSDNCGSLTVSAGKGASCTITNTVFFEGIPTLSQYGMAIMALLMLGVGFVGFRRFV